MVKYTSLARLALWGVAGAAVGLLGLIFGVPIILVAVAILVVLVGAARAGSRARWGTALAGYLLGLSLPLAWVGVTIGAEDRTCTSGGIGADGVEFCTTWESTGSIRWPWFLAAGMLACLGVVLQVRARRRAVQDDGDSLTAPA